MNIKRIQRGVTQPKHYSNEPTSKNLKDSVSFDNIFIEKIALEHEVNPEKCIINLKDRTMSTSSIEECQVASIVIKLTSTELVLIPNYIAIVTVSEQSAMSSQTYWELIEFE